MNNKKRNRSKYEEEDNNKIIRQYIKSKKYKIDKQKEDKDKDKDKERSKEKDRDEHYSDSDTEDEGHDHYYDYKKSKNFLPFFSREDKVYRRGNDVYFNCDVTNENIKKLEKMFSEIIDEYKEFQEEVSVKSKFLVTFEKMEPKPIYLHITSIGGSLFHGFRAVDLIKSCPIPVYTVVEGYAISAASLMAVVGKKRFIHENAYILIHQLSSSNEGGKYHELVDNFENNKELMKKIVNIYKEHTNMNKREIDNVLKRDLFWDSNVCIKKGLSDEIYIPPKL